MGPLLYLLRLLITTQEINEITGRMLGAKSEKRNKTKTIDREHWNEKSAKEGKYAAEI